MADNIFLSIVKGEVPAHKIYEDELTLAFLDIHPVQPGHTLVIPKKPAEFIWQLDDKTYQALMATAKKVAHRLAQVLGVPFVGLQVMGTDVAHAHVHVIPFSEASQFRRIADMSLEPDHQKLAALAKQLAF